MGRSGQESDGESNAVATRPLRASHRQRRTDDRGSSLVEILVSVVIVGTSGAGLLGGLFGAIGAASSTQQRTGALTALSNVGEQLASSAVAYVSCASQPLPQPYLDVAADTPPGITVTIDAIKTWDGTEFVDGCPGVGDDQLQLFELSASGTGATDEFLVVTKRRGDLVP